MKTASIVAVVAVFASVGCGGNIRDADGDGQLAIADGGVDCDDLDKDVWTGAAEQCDDGVDNNCDGLTDDVGVGNVLWFQDFDGDGFGVATEQREACAGALAGLGWAALPGDCDDSDAALHPAAPDDECDRIDQDCDGTADDGAELRTWYADLDGDGFGDADSSVLDCVAPIAHVADATDCDDEQIDAFPGAVEIDCTGVDEDCDGEVDEGSPLTTFYRDLDGDGFGNANAPVQAACTPPAGTVANAGDCYDDDATVTDVCDPRVSVGGVPFNTLSDAIAALTDGDVLELTPGVHTVPGTAVFPPLSSFGYGVVTVRGTPHGDVILQNQGVGPTLEVGFMEVTFEHLVFPGPTTGIFQTGTGVLTIRDTRFEGNQSAERGGALFQRNGTLTLERVHFEGTSSERDGGAVKFGANANFLSTATFTDVSFSDTSADGVGGALSMINVTFECTRCSFENTTAVGNGGAVHAERRLFTMTDSQFVNTQGDNGGAIALIDHLEVNLLGNRFHHSVATGEGGALFVDGDASLVSNNLFCDGEAGSGSAMHIVDGVWDVSNNTVLGGVSGAVGGVVTLAPAEATFVNNLFASVPTDALFFYSGGSAGGIDYNAFHDNTGVVSGASLGAGNEQGVDPLLVAWSNDGDCSNDDPRPGFGSPLVDAGDPTLLDPDSTVSDIGYTGGAGAVDVEDSDGDGVPAYLDCDDGSATAGPGAVEICNGADDDCDGVIDNGLPSFTYYVDADADGAGGPVAVASCFESARSGFSDTTGDCNDLDDAVFPGATEICNRIDDDCDGQVDQLDADVVGTLDLYEDLDGDTFGGCPSADCLPLQICESDVQFFHVPVGGDCDDDNRHVNPARDEVVGNGLDDDCNGADDGSDGSEIPVVSAGCGCASEGSSVPLALWMGLPCLVVLRRRRRA